MIWYFRGVDIRAVEANAPPFVCGISGNLKGIKEFVLTSHALLGSKYYNKTTTKRLIHNGQSILLKLTTNIQMQLFEKLTFRE